MLFLRCHIYGSYWKLNKANNLGTYPVVDLAQFKLKPTGMFFLFTAAVWNFIISVSTVCRISPINIVDHSTTLILNDNYNNIITTSQQNQEQNRQNISSQAGNLYCLETCVRISGILICCLHSFLFPVVGYLYTVLTQSYSVFLSA